MAVFSDFVHALGPPICELAVNQRTFTFFHWNVIMVDILDLFDQVLLVIFADLSKLHCSYDWIPKNDGVDLSITNPTVTLVVINHFPLSWPRDVVLVPEVPRKYELFWTVWVSQFHWLFCLFLVVKDLNLQRFEMFLLEVVVSFGAQ